MCKVRRLKWKTVTAWVTDWLTCRLTHLTFDQSRSPVAKLAITTSATCEIPACTWSNLPPLYPLPVFPCLLHLVNLSPCFSFLFRPLLFPVFLQSFILFFSFLFSQIFGFVSLSSCCLSSLSSFLQTITNNWILFFFHYLRFIL